jgi:hypothetical protein
MSAGEIQVLNWDLEICITQGGDVYLPLGLADELDDAASEETRRCGETQ